MSNGAAILCATKAFERILARDRHLGHEAQRLQHFLRDLRDHRVVIHEEDVPTGAPHFRGPAFDLWCDMARGCRQVTLNAAPSPGFGSTLIAPPCARTIEYVMARPSPNPSPSS